MREKASGESRNRYGPKLEKMTDKHCDGIMSFQIVSQVMSGARRVIDYTGIKQQFENKMKGTK